MDKLTNVDEGDLEDLLDLISFLQTELSFIVPGTLPVKPLKQLV